MSIAALPFATFLLFLEFGAGTQAVLLVPQFRGQVAPGFLKMGAMMALFGAAIALWVTVVLPNGPDVAGYPLDDRFIDPLRMATAAFTLLSAIALAFIWREDPPRGRAINIAASAVAALAIALAAAVLRLPTWGYLGTLLALLAGAASLGAVSLGMTLGHWYLVTPRLPEKPLNDLTLLLLALVGIQSVLLLINVIVPVRELPANPDVAEVALAANLWFWLRVGVGLVFPLALAFMARTWRISFSLLAPLSSESGTLRMMIWACPTPACSRVSMLLMSP